MPPDGTVVIEYSFELFELQKIAQAGRKIDSRSVKMEKMKRDYQESFEREAAK